MKKKLTLYVDETLIQIARMDDVNLSQIFDNYLKSYLSCETTETIDKQIRELNDNIDALNKRKNELLERGVLDEKSQGLQAKTWQELKEHYKIRQDRQESLTSDYEWLTSPKNLQRLKLLNKDPFEALHELKASYVPNQ